MEVFIIISLLLLFLFWSSLENTKTPFTYPVSSFDTFILQLSGIIEPFLLSLKLLSPFCKYSLPMDSIKECLSCSVIDLKTWLLQNVHPGSAVTQGWRNDSTQKEITCLWIIKASCVTGATKATKDTRGSKPNRRPGFHDHMMSVGGHIWHYQTTSNSQSRFWTVGWAAWTLLWHCCELFPVDFGKWCFKVTFLFS